MQRTSCSYQFVCKCTSTPKKDSSLANSVRFKQFPKQRTLTNNYFRNKKDICFKGGKITYLMPICVLHQFWQEISAEFCSLLTFAATAAASQSSSHYHSNGVSGLFGFCKHSRFGYCRVRRLVFLK